MFSAEGLNDHARSNSQIRYLHLLRNFEGLDYSMKCWPWSLHLGGGNLEGLRALRLGGIDKIEEINGWEGVPNLVWLELEDLHRLLSIGPIKGGLKKLQRFSLLSCHLNSFVRSIVGVGDERRSLVNAGYCFPNLQFLNLPGCFNLLQLGHTFVNAFPALKVLNLSGASRLKSFPDLNTLGSQLHSLDLHDCIELRRLEGSSCSLTALQRLNLRNCGNLESLPDMQNVVSLQELSVAGGCWGSFVSTCKSVQKSTLGKGSTSVVIGHLYSAHHAHQQQLPAALQNDCTNYQHPVAAFNAAQVGSFQGYGAYFRPLMHLRYLYIHVPHTSMEWVSVLKLSSLPSLEELTLENFKSVQRLTFLSALASLQLLSLHSFFSLEEICGFGARYVHLSTIRIEDCPLLESIVGLDDLPCMGTLELIGCRNLYSRKVQQQTTAPPSPAVLFPCSLRRLKISSCDGLKSLSDPPLPGGLQELALHNCWSLIDVSRLSTLTCLTTLTLSGCTSLKVAALASLSCSTSLQSSLNLCESQCTNYSALTHKARCSQGALHFLQELSFFGCTLLTDVSSLALLTSLQVLSFERCTSLTDISSVTALASLRELYLVQCSSLFEFPDLRHLTGLQRLYFDACSMKINEQQLKQLVSATTAVDYTPISSPAEGVTGSSSTDEIVALMHQWLWFQS
ncbi:hypothetical protein L7F22_061651 [Adiantum nelumboides]|nr:hypothetical protein [Adiantum nelumboides]